MEQRNDYIERQITEFGKALQRTLKFDDKGESVIQDLDFFSIAKETLEIDLENKIISKELLILLLDSNVLDKIDVLNIIEIVDYHIGKKTASGVLLKNMLTLIDYIQEAEQYSFKLHLTKMNIEKLLVNRE